MPLADQTVPETKDATFNCEVSKPDKNAKWYKGGKEIKPDKRHDIKVLGVKHTLKISKCMLDDQSQIMCKVDDASTEAKLNVEGAQNEHNQIISYITEVFQFLKYFLSNMIMQSNLNFIKINTDI